MSFAIGQHQQAAEKGRNFFELRRNEKQNRSLFGYRVFKVTEHRKPNI